MNTIIRIISGLVVGFVIMAALLAVGAVISTVENFCGKTAGYATAALMTGFFLIWHWNDTK